MLDALRVVQAGSGRAAAACTRLFADLGAAVTVLDCAQGAARARAAPALLDAHLGRGKHHAPGDDPRARIAALRDADLVVLCDTPARLAALGLLPGDLAPHRLRAALVYITPHGLTGPQADDPASDLTLLCASGIARVLTGQVDDPDEPPVRAVGEQSAFIGALAGACAGMHLVLLARGAPARADSPRYADVSMLEALATLDVVSLARAGLHRPGRPRRRDGDGNGATVTILPCRDGWVAISPREDHQWRNWLEVMGSPAWGEDARFATRADRVANFDALHALMSDWSRPRERQCIARAAQAAHVPSFPLGTPAEQLRSAQLAQRGFFRPAALHGREFAVPGPAFGIALRPGSGAARAPRGALPLAGVRVLDFSWVIAGPTATRYLAAFGADVIKVEAPGRGDPGRASELHTVLGQAKRAITLDLKADAGREVARALVRTSDVVIENFATGVMDRLGLGEADLRALNPDLVYVSASGLGRTGPESGAVAYGTLLQCYAGFAALNGHPDRPPRVGMAWLDPMCALKLAFVVAAALWRRARDGSASRIDFSMVEAMLWTMAAPLLEAQDGRGDGNGPRARGNACAGCTPHAVYRAAGEDAWFAIAVLDDAQWRALCAAVPTLTAFAALDGTGRAANARPIDAALAAWCAQASPAVLHARLAPAGVPCSAVLGAEDLLASAQLAARGFWDHAPGGRLPGLPWRGSFARAHGPAPAPGADNEVIAREVLGLDDDAYLALRTRGAFGPA